MRQQRRARSGRREREGCGGQRRRGGRELGQRHGAGERAAARCGSKPVCAESEQETDESSDGDWE